MKAFDVGKRAFREFAVKDLHGISGAAVDPFQWLIPAQRLESVIGR